MRSRRRASTAAPCCCTARTLLSCARAAAVVRHHATTYTRCVVTTMWFMASTAAKDPAGKSATAIRFPEELHERLRAAADERHYSINFMVVKAVEDFLERLIPADQLKLTRD